MLPIRRGNPTVHVRWNPDVAILSGDAMSIIAYRFISGCPGDMVGRILEVFNQTAVEVCEGQMMDMDFECRDDVTEAEYIRMIELKTSVLIAASLRIGAIAGGATQEQALGLYEFGRNLGIAFQLQDDYLDTYGDTAVFGKAVGNDILTNKKTFLVISALKLAGKKDRDRLTELYWSGDENPEQKFKEVMAIFDRYGVREQALGKIREYFDLASASLDGVVIAPGRKNILEAFSATLLHRKF